MRHFDKFNARFRYGVKGISKFYTENQRKSQKTMYSILTFDFDSLKRENLFKRSAPPKTSSPRYPDVLLGVDTLWGKFI
jgi:hypothetical protein